MALPIVQTYTPELEFNILTTDGKWYRTPAHDIANVFVNATVREIINTWSVTLRPRDDSDGVTIYDKIEPMTYAEIKMRRVNDQLTTVIRGFVNAVERRVDLATGRPIRLITISGENYGKLFRITFLRYLLGFNPIFNVGLSSQTVGPGVASLSGSPLFFGYAIDMVTKPNKLSDLIRVSFKNLIVNTFDNTRKLVFDRKHSVPLTAPLDANARAELNKSLPDFIADIDDDGVNQVRELNLDLSLVDPRLGTTDMSVYDFFEYLACKPFNEMYTEDTDQVSYFVFRPAPWRDRYGNFIGATAFNKSAAQNSYVPPPGREDYDEIIAIPFTDIISFQLQRNDNDTFSYFFTDTTAYGIGDNFEAIANSQLYENINPHYVTDQTQLPIAIPGPDGKHTTTVMKASDRLEFSRLELFGFRVLRISTPMLCYTQEDVAKGAAYRMQKLVGQGVEKSSPQVAAGDLFHEGEQLNTTLFHAMEHNSALESGMIVIKGREDIKPGRYVAIEEQRNDKGYNVYYVTDVHHEMAPFENFITRLVVIRGERHINYLREVGFI